MASYVFKASHLEFVAEDSAYLFQLVLVVAGKDNSLLSLVGFDACLDWVESFAVNTLYVAHRYECVWVDRLNHAEYVDGFALFDKNNDNLALRASVPSCTVEHRNSASCSVDGISNFSVVARENHELNRLALLVHYKVESDARYDESGKTEHNTLPVVEHEVARRNDEYVAEHDNASETHVLVLVDNGCDNIRAASTSVAEEANGQTASLEACAYDAGHEGLVVACSWQYSVVAFSNALHRPNEGGEHKNGVDSAEAELPA